MKQHSIKRLLLAAGLLAWSTAHAPAQAAASNALAASRVFTLGGIAAKTASNGAVGHNVFNGTLKTGEAIALHETMQPAGTVPNAAHRIHHSEVIVVEEGTLAFVHDGKTERAGTGSVIYVAFGTLHTLKNVGQGPARYIVLQIGGDTGK